MATAAECFAAICAASHATDARTCPDCGAAMRRVGHSWVCPTVVAELQRWCADADRSEHLTATRARTKALLTDIDPDCGF